MVPYRKIFEGLEKQKIRYLIAGGFAVNFHQVQRATVDLDLLVWLDRQNLLSFVSLMTELGFNPRLPVPAEDFADEKKRADWIKNKNMLVFSFINPENPLEVVDVFCKEPFPFDAMWNRKKIVKAFGLELKVVGKTDLISMKENTGRDKDAFDVKQLQKLDSE